MNIFKKYLFKSNLEKKGRTLLIFISIILTTALLVASIGSINSVINMLTNEAKDAYEKFNVVLYSGKNSKDELIDKSCLNMNNIKMSFCGLETGGYLNLDDCTFKILGTSYSDFKKFKSIKIIEKSSLKSFKGQEIIISKAAADKLKVSAGDFLNISILGKNYDYHIFEIASNNGLFKKDLEESSNFIFVAPCDSTMKILNCENGKYNFIYVSVNNPKSFVKKYNSYKRNAEAKVLIDESQLASNTNDIKVPLFFMLSIVLLMSIFIIYSSFKLTIAERIPVIGTFLSQGASFSNIVKMFIKESLAYGFIGGVLGDILGYLLIVLITNATNPLKAYKIQAILDLNPVYFVIGFSFALFLSLLSSIIPVLSIRKMQVKDVILNTVNVSNKISWTSFITGLLLIALSVIFHISGPHIKNPRPYIMALPSFFIAFIGIILIIPKLTNIIFCPLVKLFKRQNGTLMLAVNNMRTSKILLNNVRLITVSIIAIILIMSLKASILNLIQGVYKNNAYDVHVSVNSSNENPANLKHINDIIESYEDLREINKYTNISTQLNGNSEKELDLKCITPVNFKDLDYYTEFNNKEKELKSLDSNSDGIIISTKIATRYHIKKGDTITLKYENKSENFKVLSTANVKFQNFGNTSFISMEAASKHFGIKYADDFKLTSKASPKEAQKELKNRLKGLGTSVTTKGEDIINEDKNSNQMVNILGIFSYITMIIGAFGILSNVSISFIQRKRELAVLSSIGLTKGSRSLMILFEGVFQGFMGIFISALSSIFMIKLLEDLFKYLTLDTNFKYPLSSIIIVSLAGLLLMLITSLPSIGKSKKLQIVNELKYE